MNIMKTPVICSIGLIMTRSLAVVVIQLVDAKLYKDFDGGYITEQEYEDRAGSTMFRYAKIGGI
jgi:hypothetical protein